jgi:hypothetical protein
MKSVFRFSLVAVINKLLELGAWDLAWRQLIHILRNSVLNMVSESTIKNMATVRTIEVVFETTRNIRKATCKEGI